MVKIKLNDIYSNYGNDIFVEVSEEVAEFLKQEINREKAYREKIRRNKAYYSLDRNNGIEFNVVETDETKQKFLKKEMNVFLLKCIFSLTEKQQKRIVAYYYYGYSLEEIAKIEGVHFTSVHESITNGLKKIKKILENTPKNPL